MARTIPEKGLEKTLNWIKDKRQPLTIFLDDYLDPDTLGGGLCLMKYAEHLGVEAKVVHQQDPTYFSTDAAYTTLNLDSWVTCLDNSEDPDKIISEVKHAALVDIPSPSSLSVYGQIEKKLRINIDHHGEEETLTTRVNSFVFDDRQLGAATTFLLNVLEDNGIGFDPDDTRDRAIASISYLGLKTDMNGFTENFSERAKRAKAYVKSFLIEKDWNDINKIELTPPPQPWLKDLGAALMVASGNESKYFAHFLGQVSNPSVVAYIAQEVFRKTQNSMVLVYGLRVKKDDVGDYKDPLVVASGRSDPTVDLVKMFKEVFISGGGRKMFGDTVSHCGARVPTGDIDLGDLTVALQNGSIREKNFEHYLGAVAAKYDRKISNYLEELS